MLIMDKLQKYHPILVGTIPIEIDIESSDIDILCEVYELGSFSDYLQKQFGEYPRFFVLEKERDARKYVVAKFRYDGFDFEIYGQDIPTIHQNGYRHMVIEHRILKLLGSAFRNNVIRYKKQGLKTEHAFAKLLNLKGDAYHEMLELEYLSDEELISRFLK
ncbi:DUF4269 domain-containing protein [Shimazuella soli]|uniref:DUF4269 domain-containing protein n=1 Tax=Shimazuella soli TaxID=1892854 RepID=UPI002106D73E|nr:DUF4269 domain-containing protein [Shimazuella soli]